MDKATCLKIATKLWRSWPPKYATIQISKALDIHIQFLTQKGEKMGGKLILTPCGNDYIVKSVAGFDESQVAEFNDSPSYWYRVMTIWYAVQRTYDALNKEKK
jgi:hypothetical protein